MSIYLSAAVADWARQVQRDHDAAEGGWWCKFCHRHGFGKVTAGKCTPYERAQAFIDAHEQQQRSFCRTPVAARPAGERCWSRD